MSNTRTINAFYSPYHTLEAIHRAEFADFIPIPSSDLNITAVHPIPETWLRDELTPRERQDLRDHVVAVLSSNNRISENDRFVVVVATTLANIDRLSNDCPSDDSESDDSLSDDIRSDHGLNDRNHNHPNMGPTSNHRGPRQVRYLGINVFAPGTTPPRRAPRTPSQVMPPEFLARINSGFHQYLPPSHSKFANTAPTHYSAGRAREQEHEAGVARRQSSGQSRNSSRRGHSRQPSRGTEDHSIQSEAEAPRRQSSVESRKSSRRGRSQHSSRRPDNRSRQSSSRSETLLHSPHSIAGSTGDQECLEHEARVTRCAERLELCEHQVRMAQRALQQEQLRGFAYALHRVPLFRAKPVQPEMGDCVLQDNNEVLRFSPSRQWHHYLEPYDAHQGGVYLVENA